MKTSLLSLVLGLNIASAPALVAQDAGNTNSASATPPASGNTSGAGGGSQHGEKLKAMLEQLDLTDAQKTQIKQIRANTQAGKERRQQIMAVLTPNQKQKLIGMLQQYRAGQADQ